MPSLVQAKIKRQHGREPTERSIQRWIKERHHFLNINDEALVKRTDHRSRYEDINKLVHQMLLDFEQRGGRITDWNICLCAREVASRLGYTDFQGFTGEPGEVDELAGGAEGMTGDEEGEAFHEQEQNNKIKFSKKWLRNFKTRYGWQMQRLTGEVASADAEQVARAHQHVPQILAQLVSDVQEDVFNADETSLFYRFAPSRRLASNQNSHMGGFKTAKNRCTMNLCCNASGWGYRTLP